MRKATAVGRGTAAGACLALTLSFTLPLSFPDLLLEGARVSIQKQPRYDPSYVPMGYPGGDPGWERGACSDLVIRAFRHAGVDLQLLVSEDIARDRTAYRIERADVRIDHRRVRNLHIFFERRGTRVTSQASPGPPAAYRGRRREPDWRPGDIVIWDLFGGTSPNHIGIVSDRNGPSGLPLVIHHYREKDGFTGRPSEDDCLARWRILGHFRWLGEVGRRVPD